MDNAEWQLVDTELEGWVFGVKIRGVVRIPLAEIYFDEEKDGRDGGWRWMIHFPPGISGGYVVTRYAAFAECERALGIEG